MKKIYLNILFKKKNTDMPVWGANFDATIQKNVIYGKATSPVASKFKFIRIALSDTVDQTDAYETTEPITVREIEVDDTIGFYDSRIQTCNTLERHFLESIF